MKNLSFLLLVLTLALATCKPKEDQTLSPPKGIEYFPLQIGHYVVYEVDSIVYTEIPKDTLVYRYLIKEKIVEELSANKEDKSFRLNRYVKFYNPLIPYDSMEWQVKEARLVKSNQTKIQVQEDNNLYTKLIFPTVLNANWDGNAFNTEGKVLYSYEKLDEAVVVNGIPLAQLLKVRQKTDTSNLIVNDLQFEQYAASIGLVYRKYLHLESNTILPSVPVKDRIEKGFDYTLKLLSYGTE